MTEHEPAVTTLIEPSLPQVRLLRVRPDDVLVLCVPDDCSRDRAVRLRAELASRFPNNDIAVLPGADIAVLRPVAGSSA